MTPQLRRGAGFALAVLFWAGFAVLAHISIAGGLTRTSGALLALVPITLLALLLARRAKQRVLAVAAIAGMALAVVLGFPLLQQHFPHLFFTEHAGGQLVLAFLFGRTLTAGREPLCARVARVIHGSIPPEVERYARRVTLAWTVFFFTLFALSSLLYLGGFLAEWSVLANILTPFLISGMFVIEYGVRRIALPNWNHVGVLTAVRTFSRHLGAPQPQSPR